MAISTTKEVYKNKPYNIYKWRGLNRKGKKVSGELNAANILMLKALLRKQGITPERVSKKPKPLFGIGVDKKIKADGIAIFTRQVATMLEAGVPLVQTIEMIKSSYSNTQMQKLLTAINFKLQSGTPLSQCLRAHPEHFDELYCNLINSGEQSGALDVIYDRIATYKEKTERLKSKVKKALIYPAAVILVAFSVTSILLIFVVPIFKNIFINFGAELPSFTLLIVAISEFMQSYWHFAIAGVFLSGYILRKAYFKSKNFRNSVDNKTLKIPIIGTILTKASIARYARTLATTFAAGVPLPDALETAANASGNAILRQAILDIRSEVNSGMQINIAMKNSKIFPDMVIQMIAIGEGSGSIENMLTKIAIIYEQDVEDSIDNLTTLLEPIIMVALGIVIGGLIIAMYLPIFQIGQLL